MVSFHTAVISPQRQSKHAWLVCVSDILSQGVKVLPGSRQHKGHWDRQSLALSLNCVNGLGLGS